jgi:2-keto-4-pentenoate hydratase
MPDRDQIVAASRTLTDHWRAGTKVDGLNASYCPRDRADGYAIQAEIERSSGGTLFGWKVAATSDAGQKHINAEGPMVGRILREMVIGDGGTASMAGNEMRVAEPEFAFRMKTDLPPRAAPYGARGGRHAASSDRNSGFEICGFRRSRRGTNHRRQCLRASLYAWRGRNVELACARPGRGNAGHHDARRAIHRSRQERARRSQNCAGVVRQRIAPAGADAQGRRGSDGDLHTPLLIQAGDLVAADFGSLGSVSVAFS